MAAPRPLRVAVEATALLGPRTGIGAMTDALLRRLGAVPDLDVTGLVVSWRGRTRTAAAMPPGVTSRSLHHPARLAHRRWARGGGPLIRGHDVVHGPNYVVPPAAGAWELVSVHDFGPWHFPDLVTFHARAFPRLVAEAVRRGAHVHVDSSFVGHEAADILGLAPDRIHTVPLGFDRPGPDEEGDPVRGRALAGTDRYVLAVGTIEPRKDHPTLVAALAHLWADGRDVGLVVAGGDGWGTEAFETALAHHGVGDRVRRLGYVSARDRAHLLAGATCLAFPSRYEGFGLPPLEAMAAGVPVVASDAGSLPEVCGDAALLVPAGDATALATALDRVTTDDALAARLAAAGRVNVDRFSWDTMTDALVGLYRSRGAVGGPGAASGPVGAGPT